MMITVGHRAKLSENQRLARQNEQLVLLRAPGPIGPGRGPLEPPAGTGNPRGMRPGLSTSAPVYPESSPTGESAGHIRILIAIAVRLYREGLSEMLGRHERFEVVALAADADSALRRTRELRPDV